MPSLAYTIFGLSVTSSRGHCQAPTWRGLVRALSERGHDVLFLERRDAVPEDERDLDAPLHGAFALYESCEELRQTRRDRLLHSDVVIVASQLAENDAIARFVLEVGEARKIFYDFAAPVTAEKLARGEVGFIGRELVPRFDLFLATSGGPALWRIARKLGARRAEPLYATVDADVCKPTVVRTTEDLGFLGGYDPERWDELDAFLLEPARRMPEARFVVAGTGYPDDVVWPRNVRRIEHLNPSAHAAFFNSQDLTLNLTPPAMRRAGFSPGTRLFEAASCGSAIVGDAWPGIESFLTPNREILIALDTEDVITYLRGCGDQLCNDIGRAARKRFLAEHTPAHRVATLERILADLPRRAAATS